MILPRLLVLTDRSQLPSGRSLADTASSLVDFVETGADVAVVLRELDLPWPERERLAAEIAEFVPVIAAREVLRATIGTHLSSSQPGFRDGRSASSSTNGRPWGRSCHSVDDVRRAADEGASWVTLGPVAESLSKPRYEPVLTDDDIATAASIAPVYALGGVTPDNAKALLRLGVHGLAAMGAVMGANEPKAVVTALLEAS